MKITNENIEPQIEKNIKDIFSNIKGLSISHIRQDMPFGEKRIDTEIIAEKNNIFTQIAIEYKQLVTSKIIREYKFQLEKYTNLSNIYFVIAAPYISETSMDICKNLGIGCIDLSGNCFLNFQDIYIEIKGNKNLYPQKQEIKSFFSPRSSRVLRALYKDITKYWKVSELSKDLNLSLGLVFSVKKKLVEEGYADENGKEFRLLYPEQLLRKWAENYSYKKNYILECYSLNDSNYAINELIYQCNQKRIAYALSLFSGADMISPFVRISKAFLYVDTNTQLLANELNLKPVSSGANIILMEPYDKGVLYDKRYINNVYVVSDIQLFLDLKSYKSRGEEAAEFLFKTILEPKWKI